MVHERFKEQVAAHEVSPEEVKQNTHTEAMLMKVETLSDAQKKMNDAILMARDKYHPAFWYCADLITRVVNEGKTRLSSKPSELAIITDEVIGQTDRLFRALDAWIAKPDDKKVAARLMDSLAVDRATKTRLAGVEKQKLVSSAMGAGESRLEYLSALALYALLNLPMGALTTPEQRVYKDTLFSKVDMAKLVPLLESFLL